MEKLSHLIQKYKSEGAAPFESEFAILFETACGEISSKSLKYLVVDIALDLKRRTGAVEILTVIEKKFGLDDVGYNLMAFARWELEDEAGAIRAYLKSLALNPESVSSLRGISILLNQNDRNEEALSF